MRQLRGSLHKLLLRPATANILLVLATLLAVLYLAAGLSSHQAAGVDPPGSDPVLQFPTAYGALTSVLVTFAIFAFAAYAGVAAASEWSWNTFGRAVARGEPRFRYMATTFTALATIAFAACLGLYAFGLVLVAIAGQLAGIGAGEPVDPDWLPRLPLLILGGWWMVVAHAAIAFAASWMTRSHVAGIVLIIALLLAGQFAAGILGGELALFAPIAVANTFIEEMGNVGLTWRAATALGVAATYMAASLAFAGLASQRSELS